MPKSYNTGYGKPPRDRQFRPGKSGNPKGRPKGSQNLRTDLETELFERVFVTEGGKKRSISRQRALIKTLLAKALHGDIRGITALLNLMLRLLPATEDAPVEVDLSAADREIMKAFEGRLRRRLKQTEGNEK